MTQWLKVLGVAGVLWTAVGCSEIRTEAFEGQGCSRSKNMSPYYACDVTRSDLICISTYTVGEKMTQAYVCRRACTTSSECPSSTDVCCAGPVVANPFNAVKACVPRDKCLTDPGAVVTADGGANDARGDSGFRFDAAADATDEGDTGDDAAVDSADDI